MQQCEDDVDESKKNSKEGRDNRIFVYTEIQRRIIYGVLRRTYAIVSECVCEMLTMIQEQTLASISLAQKYFGSLLHNQRHVSDRPIKLFTAEDVSRFTKENLEKMLA